MEQENINTGENFVVEIQTPKGLIWSGMCASVSLPTAAGQCQFLPKHRHYQALLGSGVLECKTTDTNKIVRIGILSGFCTFDRQSKGDILKVLADDAVLSDGINQNAYDTERETLKQIIQSNHCDSQEAVVAKRKLAKIQVIDSLIAN